MNVSDLSGGYKLWEMGRYLGNSGQQIGDLWTFLRACVGGVLSQMTNTSNSCPISLVDIIACRRVDARLIAVHERSVGLADHTPGL